MLRVLREKFCFGLLSLVIALLIILVSRVPLSATLIGTTSWSGLPIQGESPAFLPSGRADFDVTDNLLTITLTNDSPQTMLAIGQVLTGLTWDISDAGVSLAPQEAMIHSGSRLVNLQGFLDPGPDMSSEWAFRSDLNAGPNIGAYGISAVGDGNNGADSYGPGDRFDTTKDVFPAAGNSGSLNGIEPGIVGANVNFGSDGFTTKGPVVQGWDGTKTGPGQMIFTFNITSGDLDGADLTNVQPMFGTDGAFLVPEPATMLLLGAGLICLAGLGRKRILRASRKEL